MTDYIEKTTLEIKSQKQWRSDYPNTSFPRVWNQGVLDFLNIAPIFLTPKPAPADIYTVVYLDGVELDGLGNWVQKWSSKPKFVEYTDSEEVVHTVAEQNAEEFGRFQDSRKAEVDLIVRANIDDVYTNSDKLNLMLEGILLNNDRHQGSLSQGQQNKLTDLIDKADYVTDTIARGEELKVEIAAAVDVAAVLAITLDGFPVI